MSKTFKHLLLSVLALALIAPVGGAIAASDSEQGAAVTFSKASKKKKNIKKATKLIKNGHYVGARGDGEPVDWTFCANGKYNLNTGGGISRGSKWKVSKANIKRANVVAIVKGGGGLELAVAKLKKQGWQVGISSFDKATELGAVRRTDAKADCKAL